ncbi:molybdate ABC transporter substrate-binding protein [Ferrimonas aestuarii]|uniref:Molybdate ABC transporter substrate-binding protein n=1 Tax=Ferrimonas aestuarii TaxID=2569539 RepID=A0A4U1BRW6_9GAMM|nr:molybdate ABC transporter substrate-binding protein [Ferrimonas aestuarii]TKB56179.1 molybdate ABC transporter substrate-binding protein [Ferrimonas aestuarii]
MLRRLATLLLLLPLFAQGAELRVAVASNFAHTLEQIVTAYESDTGHRVRVSTGSTGALYTQIQHGAPYDLFFAADVERPKLLEQNDKIVAGSRTTYAIGQLALWQRQGKPSSESLIHWQNKLAIANPRIAPYGYAADQVLTALKIKQQFHGRLVTGANILQAYQYVDSGNVDAGLVALSQLKAANIPAEQYWLVPHKLYHPLEQQAVVLKRSSHPKLAQEFLDYIEQQQQLLSSAGYQTQ